MSIAFSISYILGAIVTATVLRRRAGIMHNRTIVPGRGVGVVWFAKTTVMVMFWPVAALVALLAWGARHREDQ